MPKVKVIQVVASQKEMYVLDDQGRVWCDEGRFVLPRKIPAAGKPLKGEWQSDWKQIDLPDEPQD